jgi:hypothetical protein
VSDIKAPAPIRQKGNDPRATAPAVDGHDASQGDDDSPEPAWNGRARAVPFTVLGCPDAGSSSDPMAWLSGATDAMRGLDDLKANLAEGSLTDD